MGYKSSNPMLRNGVFEQNAGVIESPMSVEGALGKLLILTLIMIATAGVVYYQFMLQKFDYVMILTTIGWVVSFILGLVIAFKAKWAPNLAPFFAVAEGAMLSGTSCFFEAQFPGIVIQAVSITMIVMFVMAFLYKTRAIVATQKFKAVVLTASFSVFILYLIAIVLMLFGVNVPYFNNTFSIPFVILNIAVAVLAALNFILDFDFIEQGAINRVPSYFEWYSAVSLILTVAWLYIEILRLLSRLKDR